MHRDGNGYIQRIPKRFRIEIISDDFQISFESLNVHSVYAKVGEYNETSLIAAQKAGFKITGKILSLFSEKENTMIILFCA